MLLTHQSSLTSRERGGRAKPALGPSNRCSMLGIPVPEATAAAGPALATGPVHQCRFGRRVHHCNGPTGAPASPGSAVSSGAGNSPGRSIPGRRCRWPPAPDRPVPPRWASPPGQTRHCPPADWLPGPGLPGSAAETSRPVAPAPGGTAHCPPGPAVATRSAGRIEWRADNSPSCHKPQPRTCNSLNSSANGALARSPAVQPMGLPLRSSACSRQMKRDSVRETSSAASIPLLLRSSPPSPPPRRNPSSARWPLA